jgi:hypothetical protein
MAGKKSIRNKGNKQTSQSKQRQYVPAIFRKESAGVRKFCEVKKYISENNMLCGCGS